MLRAIRAWCRRRGRFAAKSATAPGPLAGPWSCNNLPEGERFPALCERLLALPESRGTVRCVEPGKRPVRARQRVGLTAGRTTTSAQQTDGPGGLRTSESFLARTDRTTAPCTPRSCGTAWGHWAVAARKHVHLPWLPGSVCVWGGEVCDANHRARYFAWWALARPRGVWRAGVLSASSLS